MTGGAYESLYCSFQALVDPGDEVSYTLHTQVHIGNKKTCTLVWRAESWKGHTPVCVVISPGNNSGVSDC